MKDRKQRVRFKNKKVSDRKRLSVFRSNNHIYVQLIDDTVGNTLVSASSREKVLGAGNKNNLETAALVGKEIASRAKKSGVEKVYFDRGGFLFHGRVKALADAAREAGLKF